MLPWQTSPRNFFNYMLVRSEDDSEPEEDAAWAKERSKVRNARIISRTHYILVHGLFIISTVIAVCSLVFLFHMNFSVTRRLSATVEPPYGNPLPQLPLQLRKFGPEEIFTEPPNDRSDAAWKALAGPTINEQGFIYIPNARELKLPAGLLREGGEMYGISMFHQLHCLGAIRNTFWKLMNGTLDPVEFSDIDGDTTAPDFVPNGHGLWHLTHCFNYIRHALQCYGDTTIEVPTLFNDKKIFIGWNTTHQCKSYDAVWDYTIKHS